ncbi:MAG: hypothetical protein U0491_02585 [Candidatus Saccharimonadales bacterium]
MANVKKTSKKSAQARANSTGRKTLQKINTSPLNSAEKLSKWSRFKAWWRVRKLWQKIGLILLAVLVLFMAQAYAIAYWYQQKHKNEPLNIGVTYISEYANYFGLDPHETMLALRDDLGFRRFRLVSYWNDIEKSPGVYDFSDLDWQFDQVDAVNGKVTLAIGLRQPRWPECHAPEWVIGKQESEWRPQLDAFTKAVVNRYKDNPALQSYQLENEYFLGVFGECQAYGAPRQRLIDEFTMVKAADPKHPVILSLANNYFGIPTGKPRADQFGVSVYKRVWDKTVTKTYFEYPFYSWYYSWRAGLTEIFTGRSSMLHELQAEPWPPGDLKTTSIEEQSKSMDQKRLAERIDYGVDTGFRDIDLWGGEWWYWRKVQLHDDSLWNTVKAKMQQYGQNPVQ